MHFGANIKSAFRKEYMVLETIPVVLKRETCGSIREEFLIPASPGRR